MAKSDRESKRDRRNWRYHAEKCAVCKKFQAEFDLDKPKKPECDAGSKLFAKLWQK